MEKSKEKYANGRMEKDVPLKIWSVSLDEKILEMMKLKRSSLNRRQKSSLKRRAQIWAYEAVKRLWLTYVTLC